MTTMTSEQMQQLEAAATTLTPKLEGFAESLSAEERLTLAAALRSAGVEPPTATSEVAGYRNNTNPVRAQPKSMDFFWKGLQQLVGTLAAPIDPNAGFDGSPPYFPQ
jgi:hypothetical protein